jgi:hypothetical protein
VLELLNIYFDQIVPPIVDAGGDPEIHGRRSVRRFGQGRSATNCSAAFDAAQKVWRGLMPSRC